MISEFLEYISRFGWFTVMFCVMGIMLCVCWLCRLWFVVQCTYCKNDNVVELFEAENRGWWYCRSCAMRFRP